MMPKNCPFCNVILHSEEFRMFSCEMCGVSYISDWSNKEILYLIKFDCVLNGWYHTLNLYPNLNKTNLTSYETISFAEEMDPSHPSKGYNSININYCLTDINPANVKNKINMILLFQ